MNIPNLVESSKYNVVSKKHANYILLTANQLFPFKHREEGFLGDFHTS